MRNFTAQQCTSNNINKKNPTSPKDSKATSKNDKPDWMKRLQEKKKEAHQPKNIDFDLFPSMNESIGEITFLDDEDDLAASYFPECDKMGSSMSAIDTNVDFDLFPSMNESIGEITYLEDEDDLAASYFPGCKKMGTSMSTIDTDDLTAVSG